MQMPAQGAWLTTRETDPRREVEVSFEEVSLWRFQPGFPPREVCGLLMSGVAIINGRGDITGIGIDTERGKPRDWLRPGSEMFAAISGSVKHQCAHDIREAVFEMWSTDDPHREHRLTARELI